MSYVIQDGTGRWFNECGTKSTEKEATVFATRAEAENIMALCGLYKNPKVVRSNLPVTFALHLKMKPSPLTKKMLLARDKK
jgi:hypothetical protein